MLNLVSSILFHNKRLLVILFFTSLSVAFILYSHSNDSDKDDEISLKRLLTFSIVLAKNGGKSIKKVYQNKQLSISSKGKTKEGANEPLTEADLRSHAQIVYGLRKYFPQIKWIISEEHEKTLPDESLPEIANLDSSLIDSLIQQDVKVSPEDLTIWVDPLDATQEFTEGLLDYVTTMVCICVHGQPTIGVVHQPFLNKTYWGWVGRGHSPNMEPPSLRSDAHTHPHIVVSRSHAGKVESLIKSIKNIKPTITPAGGAGYKVLQLISGKEDFYLHITRIKKWDICAGHALLLSLAGDLAQLQPENGRVSYSHDSPSAIDSGLLASFHLPTNPDLLDKLIQAIKKQQSTSL